MEPRERERERERERFYRSNNFIGRYARISQGFAGLKRPQMCFVISLKITPIMRFDPSRGRNAPTGDRISLLFPINDAEAAAGLLRHFFVSLVPFPSSSSRNELEFRGRPAHT